MPTASPTGVILFIRITLCNHSFISPSYNCLHRREWMFMQSFAGWAAVIFATVSIVHTDVYTACFLV